MLRSAALLLLAAAIARAGDTDFLTLAQPGVPPDECVVAEITPTNAATRVGGFGYVAIALRNPDDEAHQVDLVLRSWRGAGSFACTRRVTLEPGRRARVDLPWKSGFGAELRFVVDGRDDERNHLAFSVPFRRGREASVLAIGQPGRSLWNYVRDDVATQLPRAAASPQELTRTPALLPRRWQLLTGFDLVVLHAGDAALDATRQRLLVDYVAVGGHVLVARPAALAPGPLRALVDGQGVRRGAHGGGTWCAVSVDEPRDVVMLPQDEKLDVARWLHRFERGGPLRAGSRALSGPMHDDLYAPLAIPGLGDVPVRTFFLLILAFAILVGPVNYIFLMRRRQLTWLLVTVPVAGFGLTAIILVYGLFAEGFGIQGVARSLTLLDQRAHTATTFGGRTLYAGLSPTALAPGQGTYFELLEMHPLDTFYGSPEAVHALEIEGGRIGGAALPSRTTTSFFTVTQGPARARLRFRRRDDGGLAVLAGEDFRPADGGGTLLLRDLDGQLWTNRADGRMERVAEEDLPARRLAILRALITAERRGKYASLTSRLAGSYPLSAWLDRTVRLEPGTYLARVAALPFFDDLDLEVDYRETRHVVCGRLAAEDFVE